MVDSTRRLVYSTRRFIVCLTVCHFVLVFFSPFSIAVTSLGEKELILVFLVRLFDLCLFGFVGFLFLLVSGFVIVALPGLFSYLFFVLCLALCYFVLVFFSPFSITITSLGEETARLGAFRAFIRFVLVWFCLLFLLVSRKG